MRRNLLATIAIVCLLAISIRAADPVTVTLSDVHICCNSCVNGVKTATAPVTGATAVADRTAKTIVISAADKATVQKAVDALVAAGFYGKSSDASIKVDAPSGAKEGKVQTVEITDVHLCCGSCVTTVKDLLSKVNGVTANTVAPKAASFTVTGDFYENDVFDALHKAGFSGKVK